MRTNDLLGWMKLTAIGDRLKVHRVPDTNDMMLTLYEGPEHSHVVLSRKDARALRDWLTWFVERPR